MTTNKGQFDYAGEHMRAEKMEAELNARSQNSEKHNLNEVYKKTLRDMLPSFASAAFPKGGDVKAFAIKSMAEEIAKYEPGRKPADIERELTTVAEAPDLKRELDAMVEMELQQRFTQLTEISLKAVGNFESVDDVKRVLKQIDSSARNANFPKNWITDHLAVAEVRFIAEYRSPKRQWEILKKELMEKDLEHLKQRFQTELFQNFLKEGTEIHESLPLTSLRDSKRGREALEILYIETLKERLSQLLITAEMPIEKSQLQSKKDRRQAEFRRLSPEEQVSQKRAYDHEMGELGKLIKEGSTISNEAEAIFKNDPSSLKKQVENFAALWGEKQPDAIWQKFAQEIVQRKENWKIKGPRKHGSREPMYQPMYAHWSS